MNSEGIPEKRPFSSPENRDLDSRALAKGVVVALVAGLALAGLVLGGAGIHGALHHLGFLQSLKGRVTLPTLALGEIVILPVVGVAAAILCSKPHETQIAPLIGSEENPIEISPLSQEQFDLSDSEPLFMTFQDHEWMAPPALNDLAPELGANPVEIQSATPPLIFEAFDDQWLAPEAPFALPIDGDNISLPPDVFYDDFDEIPVEIDNLGQPAPPLFEVLGQIDAHGVPVWVAEAEQPGLTPPTRLTRVKRGF